MVTTSENWLPPRVLIKLDPCEPPANSLASLFELIPSLAAVFGLIRATFSQVTLLSGLGSSCSHPLLQKRPSYTHGSGRIAISKLPLPAAFCSGWLRNAPLAVTTLGAAAV